MLIPGHIQFCMERLESAGFEVYAVGGCVRDSYLRLIPQDYDLCTSALPEQTEAVFSDQRLVLSGKKHGTVGVVIDGDVVEITTFRAEGLYTDNRHPDRVEFVPHVETDLARRDFTVNAMAYSPREGLIDPFGGQADLGRQILRAVGDPDKRFQEDSLRILRGVRFAVKYGLTPESDTLNAMFRQAHLMNNLAKERIFDELCKLLPLVNAEDLIRFAPIITTVIPELAPCQGFDQRNPHHAHDVYTHIAQVTQRVPPVLHLRWAALLHDVGKPMTFTLDETGCGHFYGHARESSRLAEEILLRLKAPTKLREQVVTLILQHMNRPEPDRKLLRRQVSRFGMDTLLDLISLQEADYGGKGSENPQKEALFSRLHPLLDRIRAEDACLTLKDLAVNGRDLMALGIVGVEIGKTLDHLLEQVFLEILPNEKEALLSAVKSSLNNNLGDN